MGLVDSTAATAYAIEAFSPKLVAISGICAGFSNIAEMGAPIACDMAWDHQSGKWKKGGFSARIYQSTIQNNLRTLLSVLIADQNFALHVREDLNATSDDKKATAVLGPMVTGSAVISNGDIISSIQNQHSKLAGLDMETFGVFRACELAQSEPSFFGIKVAVDLADQEKDDRLHEYGCRLSARYVTEAIKRHFE